MKAFTVRLEGPLETMFNEIKDSLGVKNDVEVIRYLIKNHVSSQAVQEEESPRKTSSEV